LEASALGRVNIAMDNPGHRHLVSASQLNNFHFFKSKETLSEFMGNIPSPKLGTLSKESCRIAAREAWVEKFLSMTTSVGIKSSSE